MSPGGIGLIGLVALLVLVGGYFFIADSDDDVINNPDPTPAQIRYIAKELLIDDDPKMRGRASQKLVSLGDRSVPILKEVITSSEDRKVSFACLLVLGSIDPGQSRAVAEQLLTSGTGDPQVRITAVRTISRENSEENAKILVKALQDPDPAVRSNAADAMSHQPVKIVHAALLKALNDDDIAVRRHSARALKDLTGKDYSDKIYRE